MELVSSSALGYTGLSAFPILAAAGAMFRFCLCFQLPLAFLYSRLWPQCQWRSVISASLQLLSYNCRLEFSRSGSDNNSSTQGVAHEAEIGKSERHRSESSGSEGHNMGHGVGSADRLRGTKLLRPAGVSIVDPSIPEH